MKPNEWTDKPTVDNGIIDNDHKLPEMGVMD